jgi:signal peptidase I
VIAAILSLLSPGSGQFYQKEITKSLLFIVIYLAVFPLLFYILIPYFSPTSITLFILLMVSIHLVAAYDAYKNRTSLYQRWYVALLFFLLCASLYASVEHVAPFKNFTIPTNSMKYTLIGGDRVTVIKTKTIKRGDVVVFRHQKNNKELFYVKRCVAIGGDRVMIANKQLYLKTPHTSWVKNPYMRQHPTIHHDETTTYDASTQRRAVFDMPERTVQKDHFFMLGDNRDHSNDSRVIGEIHKDQIFGKVTTIYLNYDDHSRIGKKVD